MQRLLVAGDVPHRKHPIAAARGQHRAVRRQNHRVDPIHVRVHVPVELARRGVPHEYAMIVSRGRNGFRVARHGDAGHDRRPVVVDVFTMQDARGMNICWRSCERPIRATDQADSTRGWIAGYSSASNSRKSSACGAAGESTA